MTADVPAVLRTDGVTKTFGGIRAVDRCSLAIHAGRITGLIGPNGAGKTTLFNLIAGLYAPDEGSISLRGERIDAGHRGRDGGIGNGRPAARTTSTTWSRRATTTASTSTA